MFLLIVSQLFKMLVILLVGIFCSRIGLVSTEGSRCISNLLLNIVNPCLILTVYQTDYNSDLVAGLLVSFAAAILSHIVAILISTLLIRKGSSADFWAGALRFCLFQLWLYRNPADRKRIGRHGRLLSDRLYDRI